MKQAGILACVLVAAYGAWVIFHGLGQGPLAVYDEGTYAQVVHESFARHDLFTFTLYGHWWFEKPPLYFWLAGAATYITHSDILGIRLPAALCGLAVVAATMMLAYRASRQYWVAALAGLLLVVTAPFIQGAHEARLDLVVALCVLLAYWAAWERKYVWFGIMVALAVLAKSVLAVFAAAALPLVALWLNDWSFLYSRRFWLGVGIAFVIVAPWHMYEWYLWGTEFWRQYIGFHVLARYEHNLFGSPDLQTNYLARLSEQATLLLTLFFASLVAVPLYIPPLSVGQRAHIGAALCLMACMVLVFFTAQTRALSYLIPLYPLAALFVSLSCWYLYASVYKDRA